MSRSSTVAARAARFVAVGATAAAGLAGCNFGGAVGAAGLGCNPSSNIVADNASHTFTYRDLSSYTQADVQYARTTMFSGTPIVTGMSGGSPDVVVEDAAYETLCGITWWDDARPEVPGAWGITRCMANNSANECENFEVNLNRLYHLHLTGNDGGRYNACHEIAHSVGLAHTTESSSCLRTSLQGPSAPRGLSTHDKEHLDEYY